MLLALLLTISTSKASKIFLYTTTKFSFPLKNFLGELYHRFRSIDCLIQNGIYKAFTLPELTCSKSIIETSEECVKYVLRQQ